MIAEERQSSNYAIALITAIENERLALLYANRLRTALREVEAELRLRASATNDIGQCDPPYTAHSLLSMADLLAAALSSEDATRPTGDKE